MDAHELARWTRFAAKGGIGRCTAVVDCIAQEMGEDLMFLKDDEITVLMQLSEPGIFLGHCEGVVGRFSGKDVRFHGKLKKPVMAKRGSVTVSGSRPGSRTSVGVDRGDSRAELHGERSRHDFESPSNSRPGSRSKRTPSPSYSKSHAHMQSYVTSYSRSSEDQSVTVAPDPRDTIVVDNSPLSTIKDSCASSTKSGHVKPSQMVTSISGTSIFSVGSASVYSDASTATSVDSTTDTSSERTRLRNGSIHSVGSGETERDVSGEPEQLDQVNDHLVSASTSVPGSPSTSSTSFASTPTYGLDSANGSFESVGSISELEAKLDSSKFIDRAETHTGFVLAPAPLGIGGNKNATTPVVAPLRVSKSPRLAPSSTLPPSSPLPVPPAMSGESPRLTSISPALSSPLSPGVLWSSSRPSTLSPGSLGQLSPGLPSSLAPGQRSPGVPAPLSPGFRSTFAHVPQSLYTFSTTSTSNSPNPYSSFTSSYHPAPSSPLTSPHVGPNANDDNLPTPPLSSPPYGVGQSHGAPLSPPPSSPLPPLPTASLPSPAFPLAVLPVPGALATDTAAGGQTSPLAETSEMLPEDDRNGQHDGDGVADGTSDGLEEGNTMRLSAFDELRRQLDDSADEDGKGHGGHSGDEAEQELLLREKVGEREKESGNEKEVGGEDANSDGEVGIGLSLMGTLSDDDDEDEAYENEAREDGGEQARKTADENNSESAAGNVGVGINGNASVLPGENGSPTAMAWTRYTPTSPVSAESSNGHRRSGDCEGRSEEDEDDYWDDIYDDYRYSRYSLASKRFSAASKRVSIMSKASGVSKASSRVRVNAPPIPIPSDQQSSDAPRPSIGSDGASGYPRPSIESASSSKSASKLFPRPPLTRSVSDESAHEMLPLSAQFPAVPAHVPVWTESRQRVAHDDHRKRELQVEPTAEDTREIGLSIEVVEAAKEGASKGQEAEADVGRPLTSPNMNATVSPLLHATFGSPHSSRFTDFDDGSDQDHWRRYSSKSRKSTMSSAEGPKSPMDNAGAASVLRARMEAERAPWSGAVPSPLLSAPTSDSSPKEELKMRAIVVDDEEGEATNNSALGTEGLPSSPLPAVQASSVTQTTAAVDSAQTTPTTIQSEGTEKNPFLRPRPQPNHSPHPFSRTSLFLPHPNAPKAAPQSQGPMYGRMTTQSYTYPVPGSGDTTPPSAPPGTTLYSTYILHQLRSMSIAASQGPARRPPMTLFARCQSDLSASSGPVPILFSLDPFPPPPPSSPQAKMGTGKGAPHPASMMFARAATVSAPVRRGGHDIASPREGGSGVGDLTPLRLPKRSPTVDAGMVGQHGINVGLASPSLPIPREGFIPRVGAARPRSRSFSSFGARVPGPMIQEESRSQEEPVMKVQGASATSQPHPSLPTALTPRHAPTPLSLHRISNKDRNIVASLASPAIQSAGPVMQFRVLPSPFAQEPRTYSPQLSDIMSIANMGASPAVSSPLVNSADREKDVSPLLGPSGLTGRTSISSPGSRSATSLPQLMMPGRQGSLDAHPQHSSAEGQSSDSSDSRSLASPPPIPEAVSQSPRFSPLAHEPSLKTKLSLPSLRMKTSIRSKVDDAVSVASFPGSGENETVQVQDMDFELVKPAIPQVMGRTSEESTLTSREIDVIKPEASPTLGDAASMHSSAPRSPLVATGSTESAESADAHRQRELKWMGLFPTVPPSQARKNKRVRKLLQEGVPSSVRYLVWCHLTDSKARALPGVYAKLGKRPPVPALATIEKDAVAGFPDQVQLHTAQGPIASLLQAYLSMVPDIQYNSGLTSIAGHLLLLAPEEDAFWIFTAVMDAHLRTYFSTNVVQVEIDASLFSKALEAIDPVLTKKLYMQLSISPASITRPWFSTLFVGSLPVDVLHRVWDIFLYDGIPYLFRVGLVVVNCVRHLLLQTNTEEAALACLARPPLACLPSAAELLVLAANVKLKDDDVRKQRAKMEQQLKRTTQVRPPNGLSHVQTTAISLPRT